MPPKAKFTKEEIICAAMKLVRERGIEAVTARELGAVLGSSARPIFTVFHSMEEVHQEVVKSAKALYREYVIRGLSQDIAFRGVGTAYIQFAVREPRLFQMLFMSEQGEGTDLAHILPTIDENYDVILQSVREPYQLSEAAARKLYQHMWIYTHGIASLCATKVCNFSQEEIQQMMTEIFLSLLEQVKRSSTDDQN